MVSRKLSLKEAYLHLQLACKRSFFVYQFDVPFLSVVEHKLATRNVAFKNSAAVRPSSPLSKWKTFGLSNGKNVSMEKKSDSHLTESSVVKPADSWINNDKFDGSLPSRILHHVYLGNMLVACFRKQDHPQADNHLSKVPML
jgi:dual specificity MAP kinase phosphatase